MNCFFNIFQGKDIKNFINQLSILIEKIIFFIHFIDLNRKKIILLFLYIKDLKNPKRIPFLHLFTTSINFF